MRQHRPIVRSTVLMASFAWALRASAVAAQTAPADGTVQEAEARGRFDRGVQLMALQDYGGALAEFEAAYEQSHRPTVLYNLGVAHQALHHYPEAANSLERYLREATMTPERRAEVERGLADIQSFVAHVTLAGLPDGATVMLDQQPIGHAPFTAPLAVSTGEHAVDATASGYRDARVTFRIAGGQAREVAVAMSRIPPPTVVPIGGALEVRGSPRAGRVAVDGREIATSQPVVLSPGVHAIAFQARGLTSARARVQLVAGVTRVATVHPIATGRIGPLPFVVAASVGAAAAIGGLVTGLLAVRTHDQFVTLDQTSAGLGAVVSRGVLERNLTNGLFAGAGAGLITAGVLLAFTTFGPTHTTIDIAALPGGALGTVGARF